MLKDMGIIFGLLYAILASMGKISLKRSFKDFPSSVGFFLETLLGCIFWIPFGFAYGFDFTAAVQIFPIVLLSAIMSEAFIFYIYTKGDISIIGTVFPSYSIYTTFFAAIFIGERISSLIILFIIINVLGIILIAMPNKLKLDRRASLIAVGWALAGALSVGISDTISKGAIDNTSAGTFLVCLAIAQLPVSWAFLKAEKQSPKLLLNIWSNWRAYRYSILAGLLLSLSMIFFWLSFEGTQAGIASTITSTSVMFTAVFAFAILKERLNPRQLVGISLVIFSIIGIGVFSL